MSNDNMVLKIALSHIQKARDHLGDHWKRNKTARVAVWIRALQDILQDNYLEQPKEKV